MFTYPMTNVFELNDLDRKPLKLDDLEPGPSRKLKYFPEDLVRCTAILKIANDPRLLKLIERYFGCKPTLTMMDSWWSIAQ